MMPLTVMKIGIRQNYGRKMGVLNDGIVVVLIEVCLVFEMTGKLM